MNLRLTRVASDPNNGVFGTLVFNGQPICLTLEPYHRENTKGISCIPSGNYIVKRYESPRFGNTWIVKDVQDRSYVLFHWGNLDEHSRGCILLGEEFGKLGDDWAILRSKKAFNEFMELSKPYDTMRLTITEAY